MSEVAGPASPVELASAQELAVNPAFTVEEEGFVQMDSATENDDEAVVSAQSTEHLTKGEVELEEPLTPVSPEDATLDSPPDLSDSVSANLPHPKAETLLPMTPTQTFLISNRRRVVSLDRAHVLRRVVSLDRGRELLAEMEVVNNSSSDLSNVEVDDDDSLGSNSSDGESSYFAKHLPSPKSGRRFSFSDAASTSSAPARANLYGRASCNMDRESDASLSFSDDEEEDIVRPPGLKIVTSRSPMLPPPVPRDLSDDLPHYPQRITRIHSMGSLVSSSSGEEVMEGVSRDQAQLPPRNDSRESLSTSDGSTTTSSDPSVRAELRHVAVPNTRSVSTGSAPMPTSGRMPPVLGKHYSGFFGGYMQSPPPPPPIFQGQVPPPGMQDVAHPQPMTTEAMTAWLAAGHVPVPPFMPHPFFPPPAYGATAVMANPRSMQQPEHTRKPSTDAVNSSTASADTVGDRTLAMAYSEDDDEDDGNPGNMAAKGENMPVQQGNRGAPFCDTSDGLGTGLERGGNVAESHDLLGMGMYGPEHYAASKAFGSSTDLASGDSDGDDGRATGSSEKGFSVYWQRWLMLIYMSVLNLLSDWTCYSVAPISMLTSEAFGKINPEQLVVVFLCANAVATACEPIILSRLGLRKTVVFGALLLMLGSIVKSDGLPPFIEPHLTKGQGEWKVYFGFFLVGLSQPLYQCTPALLSASWFPERERTLATGVALNANQVGIGFAFIFGTLLVADSDDIVPYFGLLSIISTITFLGCLLQFDDAPPTPPSDTARVMRGTFQMKLPGFNDIMKSVRSLHADDCCNRERSDNKHSGSRKNQQSDKRTSWQRRPGEQRRRSSAESDRSGRKPRRSSTSSASSASSRSKSASQSPRPSSRKQGQLARQDPGGAAAGSGTRLRATASRNRSATSESGLIAVSGLAPPPSPASTSRASSLEIAAFEQEAFNASVFPPSRMMPGPVGPAAPSNIRSEDESPLYEHGDYQQESSDRGPPDVNEPTADQSIPPHAQYMNQYPRIGLPMGYQQSQWQQPYWDPQYHQQPQLPHPPYQQQPGYYQQQGYYYYPQGYYYPQMYSQFSTQDYQQGILPDTSDVDEGAEPTLTVTDHHLDINIRDDQIIRSTRACFARPGFVHALVAFTVSGIVINTLSTFMDYLVRLNGAGREYVGIVGGSFQFVIMISSLIVGKATDRTRAYYSVILTMLVVGAFGLAECGVSLDADRGSDLRWTLVVVGALVGPLQPVSTELGVDVVYPLSENTVLVIQQLFSNLLSAMFIPFFKALKDVGTEALDDPELYEKPEYTFSFYLLIVLHAAATVFFATFNGRYLRYEQEVAKKAQLEAKNMFAGPTAFHPVNDFENYQPHDPYQEHDAASDEHGTERQPLMNTLV